MITITWIAVFGGVFLWSAVHPKDYFTWFMEVAPAITAFVILFFTRKRFPLANLAYALILVHSMILRKEEVQRGPWLFFIVVSICLALSACYEFIEWWTAALTNEAAEAFLGTQGYQWDTQSDMLFAFIGAIAAMTFLSRFHDRQLASVDKPV
ncbi:MAG: DUF2238 domain-containing protein [Nitrospirota bacterium]|nr:DUF2238 domain-containing protein [Nitrospirota bacterium]